MLGKLPVPGRPTDLDYSRARAYCACGRCGWGLFGHFSLIYYFSFLSPPLWETARYRLKYCLKGPLSPKQPTNQHPEKIRLDVSSESSARQRIHMKIQVLFSSKYKSKKSKYCLLQLLFGALRVKDLIPTEMYEMTMRKRFWLSYDNFSLNFS